MGNQKFSIHGHATLTFGAAPQHNLTLQMQDILPIAYYIKKVLLYIEVEGTLTKPNWVTWHMKDTTQFDSVIEDTKYMGLQNINTISPVNGLDTYSFFRPIAMNYSPQLFFLPVTSGAASMVEMFTNQKISAGNQVELELQFDTTDDGNMAGTDIINMRVSMECVVA